MTSCTSRFIKFVIFLVILCILAAGCMSKTDTKPAPASPVPTPSVTKVFTPVPTPQVTVPDDGSKTCIQLKGTVTIPGQVCPGTWLIASDSFSCCSKTPVAGKITKPRLVVEPLDLRILSNDTFVDIGTG
jgi:hypothetical protein